MPKRGGPRTVASRPKLPTDVVAARLRTLLQRGPAADGGRKRRRGADAPQSGSDGGSEGDSDGSGGSGDDAAAPRAPGFLSDFVPRRQPAPLATAASGAALGGTAAAPAPRRNRPLEIVRRDGAAVAPDASDDSDGGSDGGAAAGNGAAAFGAKAAGPARTAKEALGMRLLRREVRAQSHLRPVAAQQRHDYEYRLRRVANAGVVRLFNALHAAQTAGTAEMAKANVGEDGSYGGPGGRGLTIDKAEDQKLAVSRDAFLSALRDNSGVAASFDD